MRAHVRDGDPGGEAFLVVGRPDPRLRALVRRYVDFAERAPGPRTRLEVPSGELVAIVDLGDGWTVGQGRTPPTRLRSFAGGLHDGPARTGHGGRARCVQLDLTPLGARALLGVPPGELAHRCVPLDALLGAQARRLVEALDAAGSWEARFDHLDRLLLARAADAEGWLRPDVAWAWRRLVETGGTVRVDALARELGCSRRHLAARFGEQVGLAPKAFARVLRFRRAAELLDRGARPAEAAALAGYADQPHLTREFRALSGRTPAAHAAAALETAGLAA